MNRNRMLISARNARETRVALMHGEQLYDLDTESADTLQRKANIYKGVVARIEPSLEAAFIDYGADRHGFLPLKEIARNCFKPNARVDSISNLSIRDVIREGQELLVQVEKEERGNKGAALTTFISLAGSYLVLMPNNPRVGGISRQIEGKERDNLKEKLKHLVVPEGMGVIIRTAGIGKSEDELVWDLEMLLRRWHAIDQAAKVGKAPLLIHREDDTVVRAIRDYLRYDVDEIIVDTELLYERAKKYIEVVRPNLLPKLKLYRDSASLFSRYRLEQQIESVYQRVVKLPSGGSISIDPTEALISIDVNSARATGGADIEETALNTNLEAADEIARQLRIRDIGGLVVIDFIDMGQLKNQRAVSQRLKEALSYDRARVKVGFITRFGLLEMSRQRIRNDLDSFSQAPCPHCEGRGTIRTVESLAASIIRMVEESTGLRENDKDKSLEIQVLAPIGLASYLLNEYRDVLTEMSRRLAIRVVVLPSRWMEMPYYEIRQVQKKGEASYVMLSEVSSDECKQKMVSGETTGEGLSGKHRQLSSEQPLVSNELEGVKARRCCGFWSGVAQLIKGLVGKLCNSPSELSRKVEDERDNGFKNRKRARNGGSGNKAQGGGNSGGKNGTNGQQRIERKVGERAPAESSEREEQVAGEENRKTRGTGNKRRFASGSASDSIGRGATGMRSASSSTVQADGGKAENAVAANGNGHSVSSRTGRTGQQHAERGERDSSSRIAGGVAKSTGGKSTDDSTIHEQKVTASDAKNLDNKSPISAVSSTVVELVDDTGDAGLERELNTKGGNSRPENVENFPVDGTDTGKTVRRRGRGSTRKRGDGVDGAADNRRDDRGNSAGRGESGKAITATDGARVVVGSVVNETETVMGSKDKVGSSGVQTVEAAKHVPVAQEEALGNGTGGGGRPAAAEQTTSHKRVPDSASSRMALFRSGLLGPVTSKLEIPSETRGAVQVNKPSSLAAKNKPLIGPVLLDPVVDKITNKTSADDVQQGDGSE